MFVSAENFIARLSDDPSRIRVTVCACFFLTGLLEFVKDAVLAHFAIATLTMMVVDSVLVAAASGVVIWLFLTGIRDRRVRVRSELQRIAELNHEVRNALQVVVSSQFDTDPQRRQIVAESVDRISVVLSRLYPGVGGDGRP